MTHQHAVHLVIVLGLAVHACAPAGPPAPPDPVPQPGAECADACAHMRELKCELGSPTPGGASCEQVCESVHEGPPQIHWGLPCLAGATTCDGCNQKGPLQ